MRWFSFADLPLDSALAAAGHRASQAGAGTSIVSFFMSSEFGVICGILIALAGFGVNAYCKRLETRRMQIEREERMEMARREDNRLQAEHEARMRKLMP